MDKKAGKALSLPSWPQPKPIWEVHSHFKCPVIGACLSAEEHEKVLRKLGYQTKKLAFYQLHQIIMAHLDKEDRVSLKIDRYLRHKYRKSISSLFDLDADAFMKEWRGAFKNGQMEGAFYVAAIRSDLSKDCLREIFGEVHMLSHANLAEVMAARRKLAFQVQTSQRLARQLNQEKQRSKILRQENARVKALSREMRNITKHPRHSQDDRGAKQEHLRHLEAENAGLRQQLGELEHRKAEKMSRLELENRSLGTRLSDMETANKGLAQEMDGLMSQLSGFVRCGESCNEECPIFRICARRILIVGGVTRIKHLYRQLIESAGGEFDYHDGYMKNGKQDLEARVRRSDLIICPVNCNSHGAALKVKKFCRKHDKPVRMIPSSSLSAISNALIQEVGSGA